MLNHQATILDDLDLGFGQLFRHRIVAYSGLKPDRLWLLCQYIFYVPVDVVRPAKDIHQIDLIGDVG